MEPETNKDQNEAASSSKKNRIAAWFSKKYKLTPIEAQACATGALVFFVGILLLFSLNWDNKIYAIFLSIAFCGAITAFITVGSLLKEERILESFMISIPFDMKTGNLPLIMPDIAPDAEHLNLHMRLFELAGVAGRVGLAWPNPPPRGAERDEENFRYCGELLQYQFFRILYRLQNNIWLTAQLREKGDKEIGDSTSLSKVTLYQGGHLIKFLEGNRFAQPDVEQLIWQQGRLHLPEHTRVTLGEIAPPMGVGYNGHKVLLVKTSFFEVGLSAIFLAATDRGVLPFGLSLPEEEKKTVRTFQFNVQLSAHFHRLTAGNLQTAELKRWTRWLFRTIKESLSDGAVPAPSETPAMAATAGSEQQ